MPLPTFAPGHDLVGRYRITELLGVGHSAETYSADDLSLRRKVVVKVLLARLAAYEDVRRAFRDRIVRSATLSHPHLERVYDGGQESGHIFMVTEYLGGGSLEDVLASGRRLDVDDTARLGRDVGGALAYLHANGFVHGDLSPNSLLFDDEGRVRVTDIALSGLAGMHAEQLSYDEVRYISPEQALGEPTTDKSDVYALALILFEAATGESPFETMTPEAMLRTRITAALPVRPELGTLDMLLAQAAVPDPRLRLDAEQFTNRLSGAVTTSAPLSVAPVRDQMPLLAQFNPPEPRTSIGFRPPSPDQVVGVPTGAPTVGQFPRPQPARAPRTNRFAVDPGSFEPVADERPRQRRNALDELASSRPPRRRRVAFFVAAVLLVVVAVGGGVAWKAGLLTQKHTVPSLVGLTYAEASQVLKGDGFTLSVTAHTNSATVPAHEIVTQNPSAGTSAKSGLVITVTVSDGPIMVQVPTNVTGEDCVTATAQLLKLKLSAVCPPSSAVASATVPAGRVIRVLFKKATNPKSVPAGSTLTLVLSTGPAAGSTTTTTTTPGATTTTSPVATTTTTAAQGLVAVPNLVGMGQAQVKAAMTTARLYYTTHGPNAGTPKWTTVVSSVPAAGTMVKRLSTVALNVK
jgi:serine/threonine protein kinase/beta-lactam-binding protein with PASTA domain